MKKMHAVDVSIDSNGEIAIHQEWNDMNHDDPVVTISKEQAGMVASWIIEAAQKESKFVETEPTISVNFYSRGPEAESEELSIFNNQRGMVVLKIDDDNFIEMSPKMAKRARDQLTKAISESIGTMFTSDDEV
tara:strand:+ start:1950 stop:2348 length:399 start_codon:yes stop_codon:yes gene_type:complete